MGWAIILHGGRIIIPPVGGLVLSKSSPWGADLLVRERSALADPYCHLAWNWFASAQL